MAESIGDAFVTIRPDTKGFADETSHGITSSFGKIAATVGGLFATIGAAKFLGGAVADAQESVRVGNLTTAVLKSTGEAANVSAKQIADHAAALSLVSGVDDEVIQAGENVLLTFTNVRNEVGKGNDIFDQATQAALDMSAALGTDLQGANIQLGKALNDPIAGITALSRAGVSFTEDQKEQIKVLQESGDILGAQKIVLGELSKEFSGAAAAAADPLKILQVQFGNLKESIGGAILPVVKTLLDTLGPLFTAITPVITKFAEVLGTVLSAALQALLPVIEKLAPVFADIFSTLGTALVPIVKAMAPILLRIAEAFGEIWTQLRDSGILDRLVTIVVKLFNALEPVIAQLGRQFVRALVMLLPSLVPLVDAFIKLLDALLPLFPLFIQFNTILLQLIPVLAPVIAAISEGLVWAIDQVTKAVNWLKENWEPAWKEIQRIAQEAWDNVLQPIFNGIKVLIENIVIPAIEKLIDWWTVIYDALKVAWEEVGKPVFDAVLGGLREIIGYAEKAREVLAEVFGYRPIGGGGTDIEDLIRQRAAISLGGGGGFTAPGPYSGYTPTDHYDSNGNYIGTFGAGGTIPGPMGKAWLATVHGGETITPANKAMGGDNYNITIVDKTGNPVQKAVRMVEAHRLAQALR